MNKEQFIKDFKSQCVSGFFEEHGVTYARVVNGYDGWLQEKLEALLGETKDEIKKEKYLEVGFTRGSISHKLAHNRGLEEAIEIIESKK